MTCTSLFSPGLSGPLSEAWHAVSSAIVFLIWVQRSPGTQYSSPIRSTAGSWFTSTVNGILIAISRGVIRLKSLRTYRSFSICSYHDWNAYGQESDSKHARGNRCSACLERGEQRLRG